MKKIAAVLLFNICFYYRYSQSCTFPGSLISVKTVHNGEADFVVFTFIDPHKPKGELSKTGNGPFIQTPLNNPIKVAGKQFYIISFPNPFAYCDTKNYITPHKKILDVKPLQRSDGIISYVIGLAENVKIAAHTSYSHHSVHIVKLRVQ
jgi:hypothetical protein